MANEQSGRGERDALRRLAEGAAVSHELPQGEAEPLRLRRLDPRGPRPPFLAEAFFAGPVRPPERPWVQSLVAAGLSLTLAGSLVALPLIGRSRSTGQTGTASGALLPAEIAGPPVEVPAPPSTPSVDEARNIPAEVPGTAPAAPAPTGEASTPPAQDIGSDQEGDDAVVPPPVPPVPPPPVPPDDTPPPSVIPALDGLVDLGGPADEKPDDSDDDGGTEPPPEDDGRPSPPPPEEEPPDQPDEGDDADDGRDEDDGADKDEGLPPAKVEDEDGDLPPLTRQDEEE